MISAAVTRNNMSSKHGAVVRGDDKSLNQIQDRNYLQNERLSLLLDATNESYASVRTELE